MQCRPADEMSVIKKTKKKKKTITPYTRVLYNDAYYYYRFKILLILFKIRV